MVKIILASKSKVRKAILDENDVLSVVVHSNVDEDEIKKVYLMKKLHQKLYLRI